MGRFKMTHTYTHIFQVLVCTNSVFPSPSPHKSGCLLLTILYLWFLSVLWLNVKCFQICMGGRHVFMGYLNQEEKTKECFDDEGWLHSGDVGKKDERGFLHITGRIKGHHHNLPNRLSLMDQPFHFCRKSGLGENLRSTKLHWLLKNENKNTLHCHSPLHRSQMDCPSTPITATHSFTEVRWTAPPVGLHTYHCHSPLHRSQMVCPYRYSNGYALFQMMSHNWQADPLDSDRINVAKIITIKALVAVSFLHSTGLLHTF